MTIGITLKTHVRDLWNLQPRKVVKSLLMEPSWRSTTAVIYETVTFPMASAVNIASFSV